MISGIVGLVAISTVGYALNLVGITRLVADFVESLKSPTYENGLEYSELAQWLAMIVYVDRVLGTLLGTDWEEDSRVFVLLVL